MKHILTTLTLFALLVVPVTASAQTARSLRPTPAATSVRPQQDRIVTICSQLDTLEARLSSVVSTKKQDRAASDDGRQSRRDIQFKQEFGQVISTRSSRREDRYNRLEELAQTAEQQEAVEAFRTGMTALLAERDEAIDAAVTAFHEAVRALYAEQETILAAALDELLAEVKSILTDVRAACADDASNDEIVRIVQAGLDDARTTYRETVRRQFGELRTELNTLRERKNQAIQSAQETFRAGVQALKERILPTFQDEDSDNDSVEDVE